jgi:hypothetical protein
MGIAMSRAKNFRMNIQLLLAEEHLTSAKKFNLNLLIV